ncbi:VCBS repeat-containing protein [bacterium]|nr:VCBS repeat-containing protein [bacterium]
MRRILAAVLCGSTLFSSPALSAPPFRVHDLRVDGDIGHYLAEDLNEDGLRDLTVFHTKGEAGHRERWLSIFYQTAAGFPSGPQRSFRVDPRAVVLDIGDVLPAHGKEIAFLARDGLYACALDPLLSPSPAPPFREGMGEGSKILDAPSIFQVPSPSSLAAFDFILDLNGDGVEEVLIPQIDRCAIYAKGPDGLLRLTGAVEMGLIPSIWTPSAGRLAVGLGVYAGLNTPRFLTVDFNGDRRPDLLTVYADSLCAFLQRPDGSFSGPPDRVINVRFDRIAAGTENIRTGQEGDQDERTILTKITDLNGDGRIDLVVLRTSHKKGIFNSETQVQVYYGRRVDAQSLFPLSPDQAIKGSGVQVLTDVVDFDGDGRLDLFIPTVKAGLTQIIQMLITRTVDVEGSLYLMGKDGRYPSSPSYKRSFTVNFDFKSHYEEPVYQAEDLNGDGRLDILTSRDKTELEGFYGNPVGVFGKSPDLRFRVKLPGHGGERVEASHLNADRRADVVITYEKQDEEEGENLRGMMRVLLSSAP